MIRTELIDAFDPQDFEQLSDLAADSVRKFGMPMASAFSRMLRAWRLTNDAGEVILICCIFKPRGLCGPKAELGLLAGKKLLHLRKSEWLELKLHARLLHQLYPDLTARIDSKFPEHAKFAEFFGFRLRHARTSYNIYEAI